MSAATTTTPLPTTEREDDPTPGDATRVRFRQPVSGAGHVDAAWWPRSRDLAAELPGLIEMLQDAQRDVIRITYNLHAWDAPAPRRLQIGGRTIRLGGFDTSDPLTVRLHDAWGRERIDVLLIAPDTEPPVARRAMEIAGRSGSILRAGQILALAAGTPDIGTSAS